MQSAARAAVRASSRSVAWDWGGCGPAVIGRREVTTDRMPGMPTCAAATAGLLLAAALDCVPAAPARRASPAPPQPCDSDLGCSLNGICQAGVCACDPAWTGAACDLLNLRPASRAAGPGFRQQGTSSWGGSVIKGADNRYHMFASEFANHCGLMSWGSNSYIVHAVSESPAGPYRRLGVAVPGWAHNPAVLGTADGTFHLWHIGNGDGMAHPRNCSNGTTPPSASPTVAVTPPKCEAGHYVRCNSSITIHSASSLAGPWTGSRAWVTINAGHLSNLNPAPMALSNGSMVLLINDEVGDINENIAMSEHGWAGPYSVALWRNNTNGTIRGHAEDPHLWRDHRGTT